jgi:WXG100 family type VII secretion target
MRFEVDSQQVAQAATKVGGSIASIRTEVDQMMRHLNDLQATWKGSASTAFSGVIGQWKSAQVQVEQALDSIQSSLRGASQTYADAENQASRLFQSR